MSEISIPYINPIYKKAVQCPLCNYKYTTSKIRSRYIIPTTIDTDFFTLYKQERYNPTLYHVHVCSKCGYSHTENFSLSFSPQERKDFKKHLVSRWNYKDFGGVRTHEDALKTLKLAVYSARLKNEEASVLAGLYMRIMWIHRYLNNEDQVLRFSSLARDAYREAYLVEPLDRPEWPSYKVLYIIGELERRIGNYREAVKNFSLVLNSRKTKADPHIRSLAEKQWQVTREESKSRR
ncbi:DUF2225 domain-containing protein [Halobacillus yeomjeoni]|uniref:DUF2225 domain-containing protein n=1 Tax=Halobacillus yeomjeoni TaxID=311194 RepID=A0A931MW42_9BACI|nr:DUF2225 domain-containing protein [Halobacillus yeomjeoni]MBH0231044.1 DUF2225 domain-containing protein [Halobacillus yeomjeoni]